MRGTALKTRPQPRFRSARPGCSQPPRRAFVLPGGRAHVALGKSVGPVAFDERAVIEQQMRMMMVDFLANAPDAKVTDIEVSVPRCAEDADCQDPGMACAEARAWMAAWAPTSAATIPVSLRSMSPL